MTRALGIAVLLAATAFPPSLGARQASDTPEQVIRRLVTAIYANDVTAYNAVTMEHPRRARLTTGGRVNAEALQRLKEDPGGLQIRQLRPWLLKGQVVPTPAKSPEAGTTALYLVSHQGGPMVVPMMRQSAGWKVDLRWWIAMADMMSGAPAQDDAPSVAIRSMLAAMLRLDRARAARYITDARALDALFLGAPTSREPSGVLDATVGEMPLVEVDAGEFFRTPAGRIVEGGSTDDRKVMVGFFGPVEMPFVLRKINGGWRVVAEPYFALMLQ
jgi:hypothetical protein